MAERGADRRAAGIFVPMLAALALGACANLPTIGGVPLPPEGAEAAPVYRDLADIPAPPPISPPGANQEAIQSLTADRAKTAQAAEDLRRQDFAMPDPAIPSGF